jgi:hypothetical protein
MATTDLTEVVLPTKQRTACQLAATIAVGSALLAGIAVFIAVGFFGVLPGQIGKIAVLAALFLSAPLAWIARSAKRARWNETR